MKGINILLVLLFGIFSCFGQNSSKSLSLQNTDLGAFFGETFEPQKVQNENGVWQVYNTITVADTLNLQFQSKVKEVCKVKGCWMVVELPDGEQAMVRFKDYGFFIPLDIMNKEVILNGLAFVEEMSVDDQRHYAKDAGKSADEVNEINTPKRTFSFEASGVLVPN